MIVTVLFKLIVLSTIGLQELARAPGIASFMVFVSYGMVDGALDV